MTFDIRKFLTENKVTAASQQISEGGFDSKWAGFGDSEKEYDWEKLASERDPDSEQETEEEYEKFRADQDYEDEEDEDEEEEEEEEDNRTEYDPKDAGRAYSFGELLKMKPGQKAFYTSNLLKYSRNVYLVTFNEVVKMEDGALVAAFSDENGDNIVQTQYRYENPNDETQIYQIKGDIYEFKTGFNTMGGRSGSKASDTANFGNKPKINAGPEGEADYSDMGIDMPKDPTVKLGNKKRDLAKLSKRDFDPEMAVDQDDFNDILGNIRASRETGYQGKVTKVNPGKIEGDPAKETDINKMSDEEFEEYINSIEGMQDDEFGSKFGDRIKKESKASLVSILKELQEDWDDEFSEEDYSDDIFRDFSDLSPEEEDNILAKRLTDLEDELDYLDPNEMSPKEYAKRSNLLKAKIDVVKSRISHYNLEERSIGGYAKGFEKDHLPTKTISPDEQSWFDSYEERKKNRVPILNPKFDPNNLIDGEEFLNLAPGTVVVVKNDNTIWKFERIMNYPDEKEIIGLFGDAKPNKTKHSTANRTITKSMFDKGVVSYPKKGI
jgi:hypothetical protein